MEPQPILSQPVPQDVMTPSTQKFQFWEWKNILFAAILSYEVVRELFGFANLAAWDIGLSPTKFILYKPETFLLRYIPYPIIVILLALLLKALVTYFFLRTFEQGLQKLKRKNSGSTGTSYRVGRNALIAIVAVVIGFYVLAIVDHPFGETSREGYLNFNPFYQGLYLSLDEPVLVQCDLRKDVQACGGWDNRPPELIERTAVESLIYKYTKFHYRAAALEGTPLTLVTILLDNDVEIGYKTPYDIDPYSRSDLRVTQSFDPSLVGTERWGTNAWELLGLQRPSNAPIIFVNFLRPRDYPEGKVQEMEVQVARAFTALYQ